MVELVPKHAVIHSMGIPIHLTLFVESEEEFATCAAAVQQEFDMWDHIFSRFKTDSELNQLNEKAGTTVPVSAQMASVLNKCLELAALTNGVFDPSIGGVLAATGYGLPENFQLPTIAPTYTEIELDMKNLTIRCAPRQILEPAAIVKGMAIDAAAEHLKNVSAWMMNAGGDILTHGDFPEQGDWNVGIQDPADNTKILTVVPIHNAAIATSGTYQTKWLHQGQEWNHQIDLQQKKSATEIISLSVIAPTAEQADTLASIGLLLGVDAGRKFLDESKVAYLMLGQDGQIVATGIFAKTTGSLV